MRFLLGTAVCAIAAPTLAVAQTTVSPPVSVSTTGADLEIVPPAAPSSMQVPPLTAGYFEIAMGYGPKAGPHFYLSRWAEDWSFLRDRSKRSGPLDALKFIPLDEEGNSYLTLSGELRLRHDINTSPGLRAGGDMNAILLRTVVGADLHLGDHFRAYGEVMSGFQEGGYSGSGSPVQRNKLFVQELFAEVKGNLTSDVVAGIRVGRQDFQDGPLQLVSIQDNPNTHITFDGVRAYANGSKARVGLFDLRYTRLGLDAFDDPTDKSRRFTGVNGSVVVPGTNGNSKLFFDPFYYYLRNRTQHWGTDTAREERRFWGARLWGDVGRMNVDFTGDYQSGSYDGRRIEAYQVFGAQTFALGKVTPSVTRIGWRADFGSGGGAFGSGTLRNAHQLFGVAPYFSYGTFVGPTNYFDIAPTVSFTPVKNVKVLTDYAFVWRVNSHDAVYSGLQTAYAGTQNVQGHRVAQLARTMVIWTAKPNLSFTIRAEYLRAAIVLTRAGYADSLFTGVWTTFRF